MDGETMTIVMGALVTLALVLPCMSNLWATQETTYFDKATLPFAFHWSERECGI